MVSRQLTGPNMVGNSECVCPTTSIVSEDALFVALLGDRCCPSRGARLGRTLKAAACARKRCADAEGHLPVGVSDRD
jgi:hypothetical protein